MADGDGEVIFRTWTGAGIALIAIIFAVGAGLVPLLGFGLEAPTVFVGPYLAHVALFTLKQASLSTLLSIAIGVPLARALARREFAGRGLVLRLFAVPLALPAIVAVLGIVAVFGHGGWLGGPFELYGLTGILLAHVFFNAPMAARMLLTRLEAVPAESWRLAAQLGFGERDVFTRIEWPEISRALPGVALLIFLLCTASFTVVLTLGGGPAATTLEVAIYQALRFDFDPPRAVSLALVQLGLCAALVTLSQRLGARLEAMPALGRSPRRWDGRTLRARIFDGAMIAVGVALVAPPIAAFVASGLLHVKPTADLWRATATSLGVGLAAACAALALTWPLTQAAARSRLAARFAFPAVLASYIVPPAVMATGWFVAASRMELAPPAAGLVIAMNTLMALPYVYNVLAPAAQAEAQRNDRLCASLGIGGLARVRLIDLPALRRPLGLAFLLAMIASLGDLTAIALFGSQDFVTLPALIYRQMGSYRIEAGAGTALVLGLLTFALVSLADRWSTARD